MRYKNYLLIIPARAGSKTLKNKNLINFCGKPLIYWSIKIALRAKIFDEVMVSTDSNKIKNYALKFGAKTPFLRPKNISLDTTPMYKVIEHAIKFYKKKNIIFKNIVLLEPTSPIRELKDIRKAINKFNKNTSRINSLISVGEVNEHPSISFVIKKNRLRNFIKKEKKIYRRQSLEKVYFPYGVIYISKTKSFIKNKSFIDKSTIFYKIEKYKNIEIDDIYDFYKAEAIFKKLKIYKSI